jgi:ferrochelatase
MPTNQPPALPAGHPDDTDMGKRVGVLLVNLGTPDGTGYLAMRRYLKEFLSDPRVIEIPRVLWWVILRALVLPLRPQKSGHAYAAIWDKQHNASPLRVITHAQAEALQTRLGDAVKVEVGMRYGTPSLAQGLETLQQAGCGRILVAPLYPQYSASTVATVVDKIGEWMRSQRWQPTLRVMPPYYDHPAYIEAVAKSVKQAVAKLDWVPDAVVASFHGLPQVYCNKGDVYYCHSHKSARLIAEALKMGFCERVDEVKKGSLLLAFQSRFGAQAWLQPYLDLSLAALPGRGIKKVLVVAPGFAADCVETLEEIGMRGRETFEAAGGEKFALVPCLNASEAGMDMLEGLVEMELMGWME